MSLVDPGFVDALLSLSPAQFDTYIARLDAAQLQVVDRALEGRHAERWRLTPATFAHHLSGGQIKLWRYATLLGQKFADAVEGRSTRQIWNMPPRFGKSMWASQWGPAWALDRDPATKIILISYGDRLAVSNAVAVRDILRAHAAVLRTQLRVDRQQQGQFVTTAGGGVLAAGIGSGITGFGGHLIVFDDAFKNWQEAHSAAMRDHVDNAYRSVVSTRLETEDSAVIVPMTRWHEEDLSGRLLQRMEDGTGEAWELVRIPDFAEMFDPMSSDLLLRIPDPLGRAPGEPIEPERFSVEATKSRHLSAGSYLTAGMYQQRPAAEEGGEIKRAWWRVDSNTPATFDDAIDSWDMKLKEKESGDFVVGQFWGRTGKDLWLVDQLRGQWDQPTTECAIALMSVRHPESRAHIVENTGNGPEVMAALRKPWPGYEVSDDIAGQLGMTVDERAQVSALRQRGQGQLMAHPVKGSKVVRMRAVSGSIEAGDVHLPEHAPFIGVFLDECSAFPQGAHDDMVDACSQALSRLLRPAATISSPTSRMLPPTQVTRPASSVRSAAGASIRIPMR